MKFLTCTLALIVTALAGCAHMSDVQTPAIQPRYLRPTPTMRSSQPVLVMYDPVELPDEVVLSVPNGFPKAKLLGARSLVTQHLRQGLESLFEHVSVAARGAHAPPDGLLCTVHFVDVGVAIAPGGQTLVGTLEWSVSMTRPGDPRVLYSWGERTVGSREGAGSFGGLDPAPVIQGAIEASLRAMLKDMDAKGLAGGLAGAAPSASETSAPASQPQ